jgi:hypothetical protein
VAGERWRRGRARALFDEGDDPGLTDRVVPPVSEREVTAESDKRSRPAESDKFSVEKTDKSSVEKTDKSFSASGVQVGRLGWWACNLGWKIREEAGRNQEKEFPN